MGHSANIHDKYKLQYKQMYLQVSPMSDTLPRVPRVSGWKAMLYSAGQSTEQTAFTVVLRLFVSPTVAA